MTKTEIKKSIISQMKNMSVNDGTVAYSCTRGKSFINNYYLTKKGNEYYLGRDYIGSVLHTDGSLTAYYIEDLPKDENDKTISIHIDFKNFCKSIVDTVGKNNCEMITVSKQ